MRLAVDKYHVNAYSQTDMPHQMRARVNYRVIISWSSLYFFLWESPVLSDVLRLSDLQPICDESESHGYGARGASARSWPSLPISAHGASPVIHCTTVSTNALPDSTVRSSRVEHSHTTSTRQPSACTVSSTVSSLSLFFRSFSRQNSVRLPGSLKYLQSWTCQKQPCTNMTARYFGNTMSGFPGRLDECKR